MGSLPPLKYARRSSAPQKVRIVEGPFADFIGVVDDIDEERTKVRVLVSFFFGRETPVELDFSRWRRRKIRKLEW